MVRAGVTVTGTLARALMRLFSAALAGSGQFNAVNLLGQRCAQGVCLHAGQSLPGAAVHAPAEAEMLAGVRPGDVEFFGMREVPFVPVG